MILKLEPQTLAEELGHLGVHPASEKIFLYKGEILPLKLVDIRTPAANIIKQEMLACGGDCAIPAGCVVCAEERVDAILLGTRKHYARLLEKLAQMPYFGMAAVQSELEALLDPAPLQTILADGRTLTYDRMLVMGILNITPDSFYADSRVPQLEQVLDRAGKMLEQGATILDVGGESTRPGSDAVAADEEQQRVVPVIRAIKERYPDCIISIDTYRAATAQAALAAGADIINDVTAMAGDAAMADLVVSSKAPIILMHMRGTPKDMQQNCAYKNVVTEVAAYLVQQAQMLAERGVSKDKIIFDPGIGFAKDVKQNLQLMQGLKSLTGLGYPVLLAASRKSTVASVLGGLPAEERLEGTIATSCQAVYAGAQMVRVHDVQENLRAIRMLEAILCPSHI